MSATIGRYRITFSVNRKWHRWDRYAMGYQAAKDDAIRAVVGEFGKPPKSLVVTLIGWDEFTFPAREIEAELAALKAERAERLKAIGVEGKETL